MKFLQGIGEYKIVRMKTIVTMTIPMKTNNENKIFHEIK